MGDVHIKLRCQPNSFPPLRCCLPTSERGFIHTFGGIKGEKQNSLYLCKLPLCPFLKDQRCLPHAVKAKLFNISLEPEVIVQYLNVMDQISDCEVTSCRAAFPHLFCLSTCGSNINISIAQMDKVKYKSPEPLKRRFTPYSS